MITIYGLTDPRTGCIRYVGKTVNISQRVKRHIYKAKKGEMGHKANWIRSMLRENLYPVALTLEICPEERWEQAEKIWIASLRRSGYPLTNAAYGGEGSCGRKGQRNSPEHRARISVAMRGKNKGKKGFTLKALHIRWHVKRDKRNPQCEFCQKGLGF